MVSGVGERTLRGREPQIGVERQQIGDWPYQGQDLAEVWNSLESVERDELAEICCGWRQSNWDAVHDEIRPRVFFDEFPASILLHRARRLRLIDSGSGVIAVRALHVVSQFLASLITTRQNIVVSSRSRLRRRVRSRLCG